ncbi:MAG: hypothetical protein QHJ73_09060, partial [Armatimonadota bacterium]|nr:hypothetical protein [Armatimonadota bacterium]
LARAYQDLNQHLGRDDVGDLSRRAAVMEARAAGTADPIAREQYLQAAESLRQQAQVHLELAATRDRLRSEVARILATLTNLRARLVALSSGSAVPLNDVSTAAEELAGLQSQVDTFHDSVRQVLKESTLRL